MKGISYSRYGGPDVLAYGEVDDPRVGPDSVLVKVRAAAVNPVDRKCREGHLDQLIEPVFPVVPGWDVCGVVVQPGLAVTEFLVGDEVIGYVRQDVLAHGTFAEYVAAPVRTLARKPRNLTWEEAAGLPLAGLTAYQVLTKTLQVRRDETILVHAAAGGVGSLAVQLARHAGARVIGTASPGNHDFVRGLGGEPVAYGDGLAERVRGLAPEGVTAVFDTVGGDALKVSANLLATCWPPRDAWCPSPTPTSSTTAAATTSPAPTPTTCSGSPNWPNRASSRSASPARSPWTGRPRPTASARKAEPPARSW
ncbi:NADPH:quinone reductase-like Zn-dependent oxidoreductase [Streptomyces tendae]